MFYKNHTFQSMGQIFCVEFQRVPLKFHTKYLTHTLKDVDFIRNDNVIITLNDVVTLFWRYSDIIIASRVHRDTLEPFKDFHNWVIITVLV